MKGATVEEPLMRLASLLARGGARRRRGKTSAAFPRRVFITVFKKMFRSFIIIIIILFCSINGRLKRGKKQTNRSTIYFPILTVKFKTALYVLCARVIYLCKHANKLM